MSLSNPSLTNPAQHYFEWKGGDGHIEFYDKEKQQRVKVPLPFEFIVLDQLNGVTGWSDQNNIGIWSNETRSIRDDFTVRAGKRILYVGPYKNEQGISQVAGFGAKYIKVIYIAHKNRAGEMIMGRIGLTGAALNGWIDFTKGHAVDSGKICIAGSTEEKKGATVYQVPIFEWSKWTNQEYEQALLLDRELQNYLAQYLTAPKYDDNAEPIHEDAQEYATEEQQQDFQKRVDENFDQSPIPPPEQQDVVIEDFGDEPISLEDIPF